MARENGNHIRIKDIAEKAGCSIGTVDRVIHRRGKVSAAVEKRILGIMKELNYKPDLSARALASKRSLTLGILLPSYRKGEFWELPNLGIREAITQYEEEGFNIHAIQHKYTEPGPILQRGYEIDRQANGRDHPEPILLQGKCHACTILLSAQQALHPHRFRH